MKIMTMNNYHFLSNVLFYCFFSVKREVSAGDYIDSVMRVEFVPILPTTSGKLWQNLCCLFDALILTLHCVCCSGVFITPTLRSYC